MSSSDLAADESETPEPHEPTFEKPGPADLVGGGIAIVLGAVVIIASQSFPRQPNVPSPGLAPSIVGGIMALCGLGVILTWARDRKRGREVEELIPSPLSIRDQVINVLAVLAVVATYILLGDIVGFPILMTVLLALLMIRLGAKWWVALIGAVATSVVIYLIFNDVLGVPLPTGWTPFLG